MRVEALNVLVGWENWQPRVRRALFDLSAFCARAVAAQVPPSNVATSQASDSALPSLIRGIPIDSLSSDVTC